LVLIATVSLPSFAQAQRAPQPEGAEPVAERRPGNQLELGLRYYDTQQYEEAAEAFRQAYMANPKPEILYALAQAYRMSGRCDRAQEAYQSFLRTNPEAKKAEAAKVNMERCEPKPAAPPAPAPAPKAPPTPSPKPARDTPAAHDTDSFSPWYTDTLGDVLTVGGLAGLGAAGVFHLIENQRESDMESAATYGEYESSHADANRARKVVLISGTAGGVLLVAGIVRYLTRSPDASSTEISAAVEPHGGGLTWSGTF
jgi:tetratricopeptide (TPR) repeat protein